MPRAARQTVCSVVVNAHPNVARDEYDRLKAILHEASLDGPATANRAGVAEFEAHLRGRISWVAELNPARGARLQARLAGIDFRGG
jgi:RNA-directed DNA polymerase